jgi:hypothetical protein
MIKVCSHTLRGPKKRIRMNRGVAEHQGCAFPGRKRLAKCAHIEMASLCDLARGFGEESFCLCYCEPSNMTVTRRSPISISKWPFDERRHENLLTVTVRFQVPDSQTKRKGASARPRSGYRCMPSTTVRRPSFANTAGNGNPTRHTTLGFLYNHPSRYRTSVE